MNNKELIEKLSKLDLGMDVLIASTHDEGCPARALSDCDISIENFKMINREINFVEKREKCKQAIVLWL
jgi:hypothetical protein